MSHDKFRALPYIKRTAVVLGSRTFHRNRLNSLYLLLVCSVLAIYWRWLHQSTYSSYDTYEDTYEDISYSPSKVLVVASTREKLDTLFWLDNIADDWEIALYVSDDADADFTVPVNKGNEAMVYLSYIIDYYDDLPDVSFFHHDHYKSWHQPYDTPWETFHLQPLTVIENGYVSTRCLKMCENVSHPSNATVPLSELVGVDRDVQLGSVIEAFLGDYIPIPEEIASPCCAQFAASREAILEKPIEFWQGIRQWLIETPLDSRTSSKMLERTWHLLFNKEAKL